MPRYFFGIEGREPEDEGERLLDDAAAHAVAEKVAEELGRGLPKLPRILVYDVLLKRVD